VDLIRSIHHASLLVSDTERAVSFYRDILGLKVFQGRPELPFPGAWLEVGDQQIHLLELPNPDPSEGRPEHGGRDRHLAFTANHLDRLKTALDAHSIPYTLSKSGRTALFCRDPDGNALEFIQNG
jgi:glyoxylase I family protein